MAVKNGDKKPWEIQPYGVWSLEFPFDVAGKSLGGVAFDSATSRLYVSQLSADPVGYDRNPIIHVFQVPGSQILPKRPSVDLDADNSSGANGAGYQTTYREGEAGVSIADDDILIGDPDSTQLAGAEILLQNPQAADSLAVSGTLPTGIVVDPSSTTSAVRLSGTASLAAYETALAQVLFENSATDPAIVDRLVSVRVTDSMALRSATATAIIKVELKPPTDAPPIISALGDVTTNEDTATGPLAFTLSDLDTPLNSLTITATSSNQALVPSANIVLAGSGANRTVNFTPAANASGGPATVTLTVSDGTHAVTEKFDVTVTPVNDPPTISALGNVTIDDDSTGRPRAFAVSDPDTPLDRLTVSATSSNQTLVPNANIVLAGSGVDRTVSVTPAIGAIGGPTTITLTVSDGASSVTETFAVTVTSINDPPTISAIGDVTVDEDTATGMLAFTIADFDTPLDWLTVTATSNNQTIVSDAKIIFVGSGANRWMTITPAPNANGGPVTITVTVSDGASSATETFDVTVTPVNDPPSISALFWNVTIAEDTASRTLAFSVNDVDTPVDSLTVTATSSNPALVPITDMVLAGGVTGGLSWMTITPAPNTNGGPVTITVTISDGASSATEAFDVTIIPVNDPPTISDISNQTTPEDTPTSPIAFSVSDLETAAGSFVVTASSSNTALVPNQNITLGGANGNRTISLDPLPNQSGTTTITVTVTDGDNASTSSIFVLTVTPSDDPPTIGVLGDVNFDGHFDSEDLINILACGKYEDPGSWDATWQDGDFDHDGDVTAEDLLLALQDGDYEG